MLIHLLANWPVAGKRDEGAGNICWRAKTMPVAEGLFDGPQPKATALVHGETFSASLPDDICGPRASTATWYVRTRALHWDDRPDGTFNVRLTETGTYHVDFVDSALADQGSQYTDHIHHVLTAGQTEVFNETFQDFPTGMKIWVRVRVTIVDVG